MATDHTSHHSAVASFGQGIVLGCSCSENIEAMGHNVQHLVVSEAEQEPRQSSKNPRQFAWQQLTTTHMVEALPKP